MPNPAPNSGDTIAEVVRDVQLMSQRTCRNNRVEGLASKFKLFSLVTTRIRLYGTDCDQFLLVQQAIQQTKTCVRASQEHDTS